MAQKKVKRVPPVRHKARLAPIINSLHPKVSVIIPAKDERRTIAAVIANAWRSHKETEVIVIVNGSEDGTEAVARRMGATVIVFDQAIGHDVGRSVGARVARGDILLFTDADIVIPYNRLRWFVRAVEQGADVALNRYKGKTDTRHAHSVVVAKHALNTAIGRADLAGSSLTAIPHALSRKAIETIGAQMLMVPPLALVKAIASGLVVKRPAYVEVGRSNPIRWNRRRHREDPLKYLIIGDHLEALAWWTEHTNERGGYTDLRRQRSKVR